MMGLPPFHCPLHTAGGPVASTLIVVWTPALIAVLVLLAVLALVVFGVRVRARIARRAVTTNRLPGLAQSYRTARHAR